MRTPALQILTIFPEDSIQWRRGEEIIRRRLSDHELGFAYGVDSAGPFVARAEVVLSFTFLDAYARAAKNLRWIQGFGSGINRLIDMPSLDPAVIITNARGIHGPTVSEAALAMMFALARDIPRMVRAQDRRQWDVFPSALLHGKTLGVFGVGAIAEALAPKCHAHGMRTVGISSRATAPGFDELYPRDRLREMVGRFDVFVLLAPLDETTCGAIDRAMLRAMKPTAMLINVGRGGLVVESELIAALREGAIGSAGLDTFEIEPLAPESALWAMPNVLISPHNAGRHDGYVDDVLDIFEYNIACYCSGRTAEMRNLIDWRPPAARAAADHTGADQTR